MTRSPLASIDLGSYTARLLVAEPQEDGQIRALDRQRIYVRIGNEQSLLRSGLLSTAAQARAIRALKSLSCRAKDLGVTQTIAVATGVFRQASNRGEFSEGVRKETGLDVKLISGSEEARLTAKGALSALKSTSPPWMVFDLGGGSTEFVFRHSDSSLRDAVFSLPLGAAVLTRRFLGQDPPGPRQLRRLERAIKEILDNGLPIFKDIEKESITVVGTGGTVTSIAAMVRNLSLEEVSAERLNGTQISSSQIEEIFDRIRKLPSPLRAQLPGLDTDRAEVIIAGMLGVMFIMKHLKANYLVVSLSDLLEGLLLDYMESFLGI